MSNVNSILLLQRVLFIDGNLENVKEEEPEGYIRMKVPVLNKKNLIILFLCIISNFTGCNLQELDEYKTVEAAEYLKSQQVEPNQNEKEADENNETVTQSDHAVVDVDESDEIFQEVSNKDLELIIEPIQRMEKIIKKYTNDEEEINNLVLYYLRTDRFGYKGTNFKALMWNHHMGKPESEAPLFDPLAGDVEELEKISKAISEIEFYIAGKKVDLLHMFAVIDLIYSERSDTEYEEEYYDVLWSFGGDIETFMSDASRYAGSDSSIDNESIINFTKEQLLGYEYSFPLDDLLADVDGTNIAVVMKGEHLLTSDGIIWYYNNGFINRFRLFVDYYGGKDRFCELVEAINLRNTDSKYNDYIGYKDFLDDFRTISGMTATFGNDGDVEIPLWVRESVVKGFFEIVNLGITAYNLN